MATAHLAILYDALRSIAHTMDIHSKVLQNQIGLTATQLSVLIALGKESPMPISELSTRIHLSSATVSVTADRLAQTGLVQKIKNTVDKRIINLHITENGRELLESGPSPLPDALIHAFIQSLPEWEKDMITCTLQKLAYLMQKNGTPE